jgi:hypothetical protein
MISSAGIFVVSISAMNYKNTLIKLTEGEEGNELSSLEILFYAHICGCCLKRSKKFKKFEEANARVTKNLDLAMLFKAVSNSS